MHPIIQDHHLWATHNEYSLQPNDSPEGFVVRHRGQLRGFLMPVAGGYQFITGVSEVQRPPLTGPDTSLCADVEEPEFVSHSFGLSDVVPFSLEKATKNTNEITLSERASGTGHSERVADCNYWLPYAAEHYNLSRDIRDYVMVPIPAMFSSLPNTNGDSLSLQQMLQFDPEVGMQMYKTFKGKPTHYEHDNKDITKAKGIILDSFLRPVHFNKRHYKIVQLLAFDRTKDSLLVDQILSGFHNAYSVGFYYTSYTCSICGTRVGKGLNLNPCSHTKLGRPTYKQTDGRLAYRNCENARGFECSVVGSPAFVSAIGRKVLSSQNL